MNKNEAGGITAVLRMVKPACWADHGWVSHSFTMDHDVKIQLFPVNQMIGHWWISCIAASAQNWCYFLASPKIRDGERHELAEMDPFRRSSGIPNFVWKMTFIQVWQLRWWTLFAMSIVEPELWLRPKRILTFYPCNYPRLVIWISQDINQDLSINTYK